jgi:hypothetical protein
MTKLRSHMLTLGLAVAALVILPPAPARALTPYDCPSLTVINSGYFNLVLEIQAGPSGAPGGFGLQWMRLADYLRLGDWPSDPTDPALHSCEFTGVPTLHLGTGATSYRLAPGSAVRTEPGDFFDDTGLTTDFTGPLVPGTAYVLRVCARGDPNGLPSVYTDLVVTSTLSAECTLGFWKNHPARWPADALPMLLGTVSYTQAELLSIFDTPASGNGLISLVHQLIATKLNLANLSDPTPIAGTIAAADALIGSLVVPPVGSGYLAPSLTSPLTQMLDDYNNGRLGGVNPCPTPTHRSTWGGLKERYR